MAIGDQIGRRVRRLRLALGIGQKTLELEAGLSRGFLSRLERGDRGGRLEVETVVALARALDVDVGWLITGEHAKPRRRRVQS